MTWGMMVGVDGGLRQARWVMTWAMTWVMTMAGSTADDGGVDGRRQKRGVDDGVALYLCVLGDYHNRNCWQGNHATA